ncbi:uncharacterized protein C22orf15 homolog isoform X3 [Equus przewalskii]|uniref:Uncharacterized protein C22orf15 homolog isoform X3 n=1 Tax=Equus przewalskii TaxID=9798 RepID=A0ABM4Q0L1_EQUPR
MFITVMFGAGCRELVNPWCSLVTLTAHLRQRAQRVRAGLPLAMSPYWRSWMTGVQSWQRSCAGCRAYPPWAMAGGGAWALGMATRSKALLQGPEGWAPCHPGPDSGGQEPEAVGLQQAPPSPPRMPA